MVSGLVTIKATYTVKPAKETPNGLTRLSDVDQVRAVTHAPTVYFYDNPGDFASNVNVVKDSLSKALVAFYPLAGRLQWIAGGRLELDCNPVGAKVIVAESDSKIRDFGDFGPTPQLEILIPPIDYTAPIHEIPLMLVQVTRFSCGGICIGLAISHVIVDGQSALYFITEWAKIARGEQSENLSPCLDRTILLAKQPLRPPKFDHPEFDPPPRLIGSFDDSEERKKETTVDMLNLTKEQIKKLRNKANEARTSDLYSRYEAVVGHMWRCASKARGHASEQVTTQSIIVDFRARREPPMPQSFFGNAISRVIAKATSGELVSKPLSFASGKIREAIEQVTEEYVRSSLDFVGGQDNVFQYRTSHTVGCPAQGTYFWNPNMEITSWAGLPLYDADFGWGKEMYMGPGAIGYDGKAFILPGHDQDGSFSIALRLQVAHMDAFKKFFYEDI
ncbi:hypothetical protein RJ639_014117 [Escallonia herrerae]|uniref:Spermidine hydroxycinnamoyl transferase n=1 Tax=Escallonia herrerae TaxID=1293975 RepID=A0AA88VHW0_9ASTE|nr:hypothetical protein RJ639_014117 [Escallonia herrerae]